MNRILCLSLLLAACGLAAGCNNGNQTPPAASEPAAVEELAAQARPAIPDVPMPVKFTYQDKESISRALPGVRTILHVYRGPAEKYAVARFFRKQMPLSGWTRTEDTTATGIITQEYEKQGEKCRIILSDAGLFGGTEVKVEVYPTGRAAPAPGPASPSQ